jgi:hypothetical protein
MSSKIDRQFGKRTAILAINLHANKSTLSHKISGCHLHDSSGVPTIVCDFVPTKAEAPFLGLRALCCDRVL